jgi:competence protein ComEC
LLSHADRDHAGGAVSVAAALPVERVLHSLPAGDEVLLAVTEKSLSQRCADGQQWTWDGVSFSVLHPPEDFQAHKSNAFACVLRIEAAGKVMLLTSDIEAAQESALVARHRGELAADVLTVPHHGSKTSSTTEFIATVGAHDAVLPVGYRNRFGHPKQEIVDRYLAVDTGLQRTDADGAVTVELSAQEMTITKERELRQRYWHGR